MKTHSLALFTLCLGLCGSVWADKVVWSGNVDANGSPSALVPLQLGKQYQIKVSGAINLGKWWQAGKPLEEDAFYEYNPAIDPYKLESLKNSLNLPLSTTDFHTDHIYTSKPFTATQGGIHFWVSDIDYSDNTGAFQVQVLQVENATSQIDNADSTEVARGGEGRDESLENRSDRADDRDDDSFRQERLNDELDNSEMRQENREDRDPNFQPERN